VIPIVSIDIILSPWPGTDSIAEEYRDMTAQAAAQNGSGNGLPLMIWRETGTHFCLFACSVAFIF
jgi:hypothetical protein